MDERDFPKLAAPARRALEAAGYRCLDDLTRAEETDLLQLHGMGPDATARLKAALAEQGKSFAQ